MRRFFWNRTSKARVFAFVENLAHSLVGGCLGRAGLAEKVPGGTLALVVVANIADVDVVSGYWGQLFYLKYHRGITHSIIGGLVISAACAVLLWAIGRLRSHPARFGEVFLAVMTVAATHPLLDFTNSYGLRPFLPFSGAWYYGDLVYIVDPYLWLILGAGLFLTARRNRLLEGVWLLGAIVTSALVIWATVVLRQWGMAFVWIGGIALVLSLKRRRAIWSRRAAVASLAVMCAYWSFLGIMRWYTMENIYPQIQARYPAISRQDVAATPRAATPFEWDIFFEDSDKVYYAKASSFSGVNPGFVEVSRNAEDPAARAAARSCPGAVFAEFARYEFFEVKRSNTGAVVKIKDGRFVLPNGDRGFGTFTIRLDAADQIPCPGRTGPDH